MTHTFLARFRVEAQNMASLSHLNIAHVHDYGEAPAEGEHVAYLVMELVDGEPLSAIPCWRFTTRRPTGAGLSGADRGGVGSGSQQGRRASRRQAGEPDRST